MTLTLELGRRRNRLPAFIATEAAECGLACLAMIGRYHGHDIDLNGLRQRFSLSITGATLRHLMVVADQLGFSSRALTVDIEALRQLNLPAILHWNLSHFVVLKAVGRNSVVVHDPAHGARTYSLVEAGKHFTGVVLELTPAPNFRKIEARRPIHLSHLWSATKGFWGAVVQVLGLSAALQIAAFAAPFQLQLVVDEALGRSDGQLLTVLALGFGALVVLQALLDALRAWSLQVFGSLFTFQVVGNVVRHLLRLPADFFEKRHVGDILSRVGSTSAIQDVLARGIVSAVIDGVMALMAATILFLYSPLLAGVVIAAVALNFLVSLLSFPIMRARTEEQLVVNAKERTHLMESARAATTIKLMGGEAEREGAWRNLYADVVNATISLGKIQITVGLIQSIVTGLQTILVIYLGGRAILDASGFSVGMLVAFLSFRQTFSDRAVSLVNQAVQFRLLGLHLERLSDIVATPPEARGDAPASISVVGAISLQSVSFRYGDASPLLFENIDLEIEPGEFLAITGPSGGGKTTLVKLLLGLTSPCAGEILLDGQRVSPELWRAWRRQVGVVAQDDRLLSGTIADNIAFFDPELNMHRVREVATAAQVHDDIMRLPMQYLSLVGDMGSSLSGGQRQRVLLARALYRQPSVLILDEGTANLDPVAEGLIADLVEALPITRIIVAHRPALIERARRKITIVNGQIVSAAELGAPERALRAQAS